MPQQTVTHSIETGSEPEKLLKLLAEAENIPKWAPVFADKIDRIGESRCRVTKSGEAFEFEVIANKAAGTVDYLREMPGGKRGGGAYIRVIPRPLGGSSISITVPMAPNTTPADLAKLLDQELAELVRLSQS